MQPQAAARMLGIPFDAIDFDETKVLKRYVDFRAWQDKPVWYPCRNGFLRFGKDADDTKRGLHILYIGVPMVYVETTLMGEYVIAMPPDLKAPTGYSSKLDIIFLKAIGIMT